MRTSVVCIYERTKDYYAVEYKTDCHVNWDRKEIPEPVGDLSTGEDIPCFVDAWERKDAPSGEKISGFAVRLHGSSDWDFDARLRLAHLYGWSDFSE